jgi:hypothetical protein
MSEAALHSTKWPPRDTEGPQEVSTRALSIIDQGKAVVIKTAGDYRSAGELWTTIKGIMKQVDESFDPIISKAHQAHKEAVAQKAKIYDPLKAVYVSVKGLMSKWDDEQTRLRKLEETRLLAIQKADEEKARQIEIDRLKAEAKAEEDRLMEAALAAEASGDKQGAEVLTAAAVAITEEVKQESAAILAAPIQVAVVLPKMTPKVAGISYSTRWSASVTDIKALCLAIGTGRASTEFVIGLDRDKDTKIVTSPSLNKQATSMQNTLAIPGVTAISKRC